MPFMTNVLTDIWFWMAYQEHFSVVCIFLLCQEIIYVLVFFSQTSWASFCCLTCLFFTDDHTWRQNSKLMVCFIGKSCLEQLKCPQIYFGHTVRFPWDIYPPLFNLDIFLCDLSQLVSQVISVSLQAPVLLQQGLFFSRHPIQLQLGFKITLLCLC